MAGSSRPAFLGTVRFRIMVTASLVVAVVLVITAFVLVGVQRRQLTQNLDIALEQRADDLVVLLMETGTIPDPLPNRNEEDTFAQVVSEDGVVLAASGNIAGQGPVAGAPPGGALFRTVDDAYPDDDDPFRVLSSRVVLHGRLVVIHVGANADDVTDASGILTVSLMATVPIVVGLIAVLVWWLVGRTLAPVDEMRTEVDAIGGSDLHRRVPEPPGDNEIARLARTMNQMLDRVEDASVLQQRFVADASHELRSPLTRIRTELEVAARDDEETRRSVLEDTVELQRLVEDLLHLARADAGVAVAQQEPVDLDDLVLRAARRLKANGRVKVDTSNISAAHVLGDADQLTRALRNLTDNAERHARSSVAFSLLEADGAARLSVTDDGEGIPPNMRELIFTRFARKDEARSRSSGGTGLGLAITKDIVERHGGTLVLDTAFEHGTRLVMELPLHD